MLPNTYNMTWPVARGCQATVHGASSMPRSGWEWEPYGFPSPCWTHLLQPFRGMRREIYLALPCLGLDACSHALTELGIPFYVEYGHDTQMGLLGPITDLHGPNATGIQLGTSGDILAVDISTWRRVDGIVSGPPCPPWSDIGLQHGWDDARAAVFQKVTDIIVDQGHKGAYFFIVEMVEGMSHIRARDAQYPCPASPHTVWVAELGERAPMWEVHVWRMNTKRYLPQNRPRLYTVGVNTAMGCRSPTPPLRPHLAVRPGLDNILHPGIPAIQENTLSTQHRHNLDAAKRHILNKLSAAHGDDPARCREVWAAIALDRNPDRQWGVAIRLDGTVATLRTAHVWQWILHWRDGELLVSRRLHPIEHLTLQGFPPELAESMSQVDVVKGAGNACSVPVMGAVLACVLQACPGLMYSGPHPTVHGGPLSEHRLRKRQRMEALRTDIAILQAEAILVQQAQMAGSSLGP